MTIVAHSHSFVVGVDTHARNHVYAVVAAGTGELVDTRGFPTTIAGINRALAWVGRLTGADLGVLWVVEGAATYGMVLAGMVEATGYMVVEAPRMSRRAHHGVGKSDTLDAARIGHAVLALEPSQLRQPRMREGAREALRILLTARDSMTGERTRAVNALTAMLRRNDLGLDARKPLSTAQIQEVSRWRGRDEELALSIAREEAIRLARQITALDETLKTNMTRLSDLVAVSGAAPLLELKGFGPITAATCLTVWSHRGRIHSEAAYASIAGVSPIPASSGNTVRYRLNRGGDRTLNRALHFAAITRMTHDEETREYVQKRLNEGKTPKEIRRCIKRYLARSVYRILNKIEPDPITA